MRHAVLALMFCGCGLRSVGQLDGGAGGGGAATGGGSGGAGGGSSGTYEYAAAMLDDPSDAGRVMAISGPASNLFAVSNFGKVYRSTDGLQFNRVLTLGRGLTAVYVAPDGAVFLSSGADLAVCRAPPCVTAAAFTWSRPPGTAVDTSFYGLCGDGSSNVFAVGLRGNFNSDGVVVRYDGTAWSAESTLGVTNVRSCWLESGTVVWAAGMGQVAKWSAGTATAEGADLSPLGNLSSAQQWFAVFGVSGDLHVVGWSESIMSRTASDRWSLTLNHSTLQLALWFRAVAGLRADEVFAAGTPPSCSGCGNRVWRWNGSAWSTAPSFPLLGEVRSSHVVPPGIMYFGGQVDGPADTAAIVRVVRQ